MSIVVYKAIRRTLSGRLRSIATPDEEWSVYYNVGEKAFPKKQSYLFAFDSLTHAIDFYESFRISRVDGEIWEAMADTLICKGGQGTLYLHQFGKFWKCINEGIDLISSNIMVWDATEFLGSVWADNLTLIKKIHP